MYLTALVRHYHQLATCGAIGALVFFVLPVPSTARSMMVGQFFLVLLTGACQFGHGVGG